MKICICRTPGCVSENREFEWDDSPLFEGEEPVIRAGPWCGGCSTKFTDIVAAAGDFEPEVEPDPGEVEEPTGS